MQRSVAIVLTALFSWLIVVPLLLPSWEAALPACCRRNGQHRCAMADSQPSASGSLLTAIKPKCPGCPAATMLPVTQVAAPGTAEAIFAGLVRHPAVSPQIEASYRISQDRARYKRGPPSFLLA